VTFHTSTLKIDVGVKCVKKKILENKLNAKEQKTKNKSKKERKSGVVRPPLLAQCG
jgi:hypothetical protein